MAMKFNVPSIVCQGCADEITKEIKTHEPSATIEVDVEKKVVTVETGASEETIRQAITAVGHQVE